MRCVFADTTFYFALLNPRDQYALAACEFADAYVGRVLTTSEVLTEVANGLSGTHFRAKVFGLWKALNTDADVEIIYADAALWVRALELYSDRQDKGWSLTDCMSFLVMQDYGVTEALTADHHFEQAGFEILLKP